jgi:hypothetical protein
MIVMMDECLDLSFQVCREEVVVQQDAGFLGFDAIVGRELFT